MKTDHNLVWSEIHADKSITIGFTKKCIDEYLGECFHVMQADSKTVRAAGPMLVLETNDGLESIKSPFSGSISYFNPKARNYPDKITEVDTILTILPPGVEKVKVEKKVSPQVIGNWTVPGDYTVQFNDLFQQAVTQPNRIDRIAIDDFEPAPPRTAEEQAADEQRIQQAINRIRRPR